MRKSINAILLVLATVLAVPAASYAAGLGTIKVRSALGQPLDAEIEVVSVQPGEDFQVRLASREAYAAAGIEVSPALQGARFTIERRDGKTLIRVRTTQPVNDPFFTVLVELQSPSGRLAREYTVLVDPAEYKTATASAPAPQAAITAPAPAVVAPAAAPTPSRTQTQTPKAAAKAPVVAPAPSALVAVAPAPTETVAVAAPTIAPAATSVSVATVAPQAPAAAPAPVTATAAQAVPAPTPAPAPAPAAQVTAPVPAPASTQAQTIATPAQAQPVAAALAASVGAPPAPPAPAAAPQAPASLAQTSPASTQLAAPASPTVVPEPVLSKAQSTEVSDSYRIKRGDTLGAIARKWKPEGVTYEQMLVGLFQTNRQVFIRDNINLIRAGATIFIPGREDALAISAADAARQVRVHMAAFTRHRDTAVSTGAGSDRISQAQRGEAVSRRVGVKKSTRAM